MIRVAATGSASTGKSAVLNALFRTRFAVDARSRSTIVRAREIVRFGETDIEVIDNPPLPNPAIEMDADVYLLICDKDLTEPEYDQAVRICRRGRLLGVVLNKSDTYSESQLTGLLQNIRSRVATFVASGNVVACAADPVRLTYRGRPDGTMLEKSAPASPDTRALELLVRRLISQAEGTFRVRTRELAIRASDKVSTFLKERLR
jgi:GTPase SAR1 family protein